MSLNGDPGASDQKYGDMRDYMATSLFQPHKMRQAIRDAHAKKIPPMVGFMAGLPSIPVVRWLAPLGYDWAWIDWEHSAMNIETMTTMVHDTMFMSGGRTVPWVRVPGHDHAMIGYALDAGASVVVPQVNTVEEAKHVVGAMKYGTRNNGTRSAPPYRLMAGVTDIPTYPGQTLHESLNDQAALMIQTESLEGINNLDAILTACPEIDVCWLGPLDTRVSMGLPGHPDPNNLEPEWVAAKEKFHAILKKHNKPWSLWSFAQGEALRQEMGEMALGIVAADTYALSLMAMPLNHAREVFPRKRS